MKSSIDDSDSPFKLCTILILPIGILLWENKGLHEWSQTKVSLSLNWKLSWAGLLYLRLTTDNLYQNASYVQPTQGDKYK